MKGARETWPNIWREARETVDVMTVMGMRVFCFCC
jgi:hypothetical protein